MAKLEITDINNHISKTEILKNITASLINGGIGRDGHTVLEQAALEIEKKMQMVKEREQLLADLIVLHEEQCRLEFELVEL
jgi:hypothetical protein